MSILIPLQYYGNAVYHEDKNIITTGFSGNIIKRPIDGIFYIKKMGKLQQITEHYVKVMVSIYKSNKEFEKKVMNREIDKPGIISDWHRGYTKTQICGRKNVSASVCARILKGM